MRFEAALEQILPDFDGNAASIGEIEKELFERFVMAADPDFIPNSSLSKGMYLTLHLLNLFYYILFI
jgi:hypothetical protein